MFGYVVADASSLTEDERCRYRGCYCGLCRTIGNTYGQLQRAALNYDMTFLILLLSSLYEPAETTDDKRCLVHPVTSRTFWQSEITDYAASMNMALAYHNCMDDWHDDKKLKSGILAAVFHGSTQSVEKQYPRQWAAIQACLDRLKEIESQNLQNPDLGAAAFGALMAEILVWKEDHWSATLRKMGDALGRYIYLLDALLDLEDDQKSGSYNPFTSRAADGLSICEYLPVLKILMGECTEAMEQLPLLQDLGLIRNILYSGVWAAYHRREYSLAKEVPHV